MSMRINAYKPHENMLIGQVKNRNMLIDFETDGEIVEKTTAVQLVKVNYHEDATASFQIFPPDQLAEIKNLQNDTSMTIHNYQPANAVERFGFYKYSLAQQNNVSIWAYENDTKIYKETYPENTLTFYTTLQRYQKLNPYTFETGETLFSNKPLSCSFNGMGRALNLSHARGKVFIDNSRRVNNVVHVVSHYDNNTVFYQTSVSLPQQSTVLSKNQEFTFTSELTNPNIDFWTVNSTKDVSVFATGGSQDSDTVFPAQNINDQGILTGLQNTPCVTIWDTANPRETPTYQLIVNYSDGTTDTTYTDAGKTITLFNKNYVNAFARVYLIGATSSTVYISCGSEGDGGGNNSTNAVPIKFLSSRIVVDDSVDNPSHIPHVAFGIQFQTGAETITQYNVNFGTTGAGSVSINQTRNPTTSNTQPDGTKLLHYNVGNDIDNCLFTSTHTTTLFYIITQISEGEEAITGTCDGVNIDPINCSETTMNSKNALNMNLSGLSQVIGDPIIYDTSTFGITTLCIFRKEQDSYNHNWVTICGHGQGSGYFVISRYGGTNYIAIQFKDKWYLQNDEKIAFDFANPVAANHLVYGSVKQTQTDPEEFEFIFELHRFTTAGTTSTLVDQRIFVDNSPPAGGEAGDKFIVGMDQLTSNTINHYGSIILAEARHYKGNFTTTDKDNLIQDIISYWET